jgi:hypothetical protein
MAEIKYRLELNEEQMSVMREALEEYFRVRMGQWWDFADALTQQNIDLSPDNPRHKEIFERFITERDCIRRIFESAGGILSLQTQQKTERMLIAEDMWQVIRHEMWVARGVKDDWCVDSREPMQFSNEPLPKIERTGGEGNGEINK